MHVWVMVLIRLLLGDFYYVCDQINFETKGKRSKTTLRVAVKGIVFKLEKSLPYVCTFFALSPTKLMANFVVQYNANLSRDIANAC